MRFVGRLAIPLVILAAAGCGLEDSTRSSPHTDPAESPTPSVADPSTASATGQVAPTGTESNAGGTSTGTTVTTADSEFGPMRYDASGQPIYLFTAESGDGPVCYDDCAEDWPPVLTTDAPRGAADVQPRLLGSTRRTDGGTQVTYAGHPLYYYAHEGKYEVLCHDVEEYGGTWLAVRPDGTPAPG